MTLYFTYESRDTLYLKPFSLFLFAKLITKLVMRERKLENINFKKYPSYVVHVLQTTRDLVISRCCFAEDSKEMYQEL